MTSRKCIWQTFTLFPCKNKKTFIHNNNISVNDLHLHGFTCYIYDCYTHNIGLNFGGPNLNML